MKFLKTSDSQTTSPRPVAHQGKVTFPSSLKSCQDMAGGSLSRWDGTFVFVILWDSSDVRKSNCTVWRRCSCYSPPVDSRPSQPCLPGIRDRVGKKVPIQKKKKRFRWSPRPKQRATSKSTPSIHLQQQAPWLRESPLQKWHLITTFKHHSQEAELTPRSKSIRENSMPHVTVGAAKGNLEKRRSFNFAKWRSRHPMEMSSKSEWKKPELGKLDYLLYIIYIYSFMFRCAGSDGLLHVKVKQLENPRQIATFGLISPSWQTPSFKFPFFFGGGQVPPMFIRFIHIFPMKVSKILKVSSPKYAVVWNQGARSVDWSWQCHAPSRGCPFSGIKMDQGFCLVHFVGGFLGKTSAKITLPEN